MIRILRVALAALFLAVTPGLAQAADVTVFAAASLSDVMNTLSKDYQKDTGTSVVVSLAASSTLAHQIEASSGADIFLSADTDWMDYLDQRGLIAHDSRENLLGNRLVLIAPRDSTVALALGPHADILSALKGGRLAIADPDSVPAGKYGRTALTSLGVWNGLVNHLVQAENVRVALEYVSRGEAPLGIVYETDAKADPGVKVIGLFAENTHQPIVYPAALTKDAKPAAAAFLKYLSTAHARDVFQKAGFTVLAP